MLLRPVTLDDVVLDQALTCDLYMATGTLLAVAGTRLDSPEQLHRLTGQPLYRRTDGVRPASHPGERLQAMAAELAAHLLRRLGLYPPGTLVRLVNRETAVVTRHPGRRQALRQVVSFLDARGRAYERPQVRDLQRHPMLGPAEPDAGWPAIDWARLWGY